MKLDKKNALLTALALAVAAAAVYLRGFPALVHIVFYAVLVPLLSEEAEETFSIGFLLAYQLLTEVRHR